MEYGFDKLLEAFVQYGVKAIFLGGVIVAAVFLGKTLRDKKDKNTGGC